VKESYWKAEDEYVSRTKEASVTETPCPQVPIRLSQYRVAWQEQLVLRMHNIPHLVINSPHVATEATGSLPSLVDLDRGVMVGRMCPIITNTGGGEEVSESSAASTNDNKTATSTSTNDNNNNNIQSKNGILQYLLTEPSYKLQFADSNFTPSQNAQSKMCTSLLQNELNVILLALRFGNTAAWDDVYWHRCVNACLDPDSELELTRLEDRSTAQRELPTSPQRRLRERGMLHRFTTKLLHGDNNTASSCNGRFHLMAWFQAWSERAVILKDLTLSSGRTNNNQENTLFQNGTKEVDVSNALQAAKACYQALDSILDTNNNTTATNLRRRVNDDDAITTNIHNDTTKMKPLLLLGTTTPSLVDTILFAHLAEALCDVHLITVLVEYKNLVRYFQMMYEMYFVTDMDPKPFCYSSLVTRPKTPPPPPTKVWIGWNDRRNGRNQFNRIPIDPNGKMMNEPKNQPLVSKEALRVSGAYKDAIKIMQSVSLHCRDLDEVLMDARVLRLEEKRLLLKNERGNVEDMIHRLRMGGSMKAGGGGDSPKSTQEDGKDGEEKEEEEDDYDSFAKRNMRHMRNLKREAKMHDELWISGVVVSTIFGFVLAAAKSSTEGDS